MSQRNRGEKNKKDGRNALDLREISERRSAGGGGAPLRTAARFRSFQPMPSPGPVLAVDYGTKRLGLAVSDPSTGIALPVPAIHRTQLKKALAALAELIAEREIGKIVVGLPIHMDGRAGPEAAAARAFSERLAAASGLTVDLLDERWTTQEALRSLRETEKESRRRKKRRSGALDSAAAALLLSTYLARESVALPQSAGRDPGDDVTEKPT